MFIAFNPLSLNIRVPNEVQQKMDLIIAEGEIKIEKLKSWRKEKSQSGTVRSFPVHFMLSLLLFHGLVGGLCMPSLSLTLGIYSHCSKSSCCVASWSLAKKWQVLFLSVNIKCLNITPLAITLMNEDWLRPSSSVGHLPGYLLSTHQALFSPVWEHLKSSAGFFPQKSQAHCYPDRRFLWGLSEVRGTRCLKAS